MYKVYMNKQLVGYAEEVEIDMPWFRAKFSSTLEFQALSGVFEALIRSQDAKLTDQLAERIKNIQVLIVDEDKGVRYSSDPGVSGATQIKSVRVDSGEIRWRPR